MDLQNSVKQIKITSIKSLEVAAKEIANSHFEPLIKVEPIEDNFQVRDWFEKEFLAMLIKANGIMKLNQVVIIIGSKPSKDFLKGSFSVILQGDANNLTGEITEELNKTRTFEELYFDGAYWDYIITESLNQTLVVITESY